MCLTINTYVFLFAMIRIKFMTKNMLMLLLVTYMINYMLG